MDCNTCHRPPYLMSCEWLRVTRSAYTCALFRCLASKMAVNGAYCNPSLDPLNMTSHSQKGGRSLDNSCSLCVKLCAWRRRTCSVSCYAIGSYWFLTQYRTVLQTMRIVFGANSLLACLYTVLTPKMTPRIGTCEYAVHIARGT